MISHPMNVVLLDLDGTLTQSDPGIIACVIKAFEALELPVPDKEELQRFIGPAISESLKRNNVPESKLQFGIDTYRDYYANKAVFDDPNNPGRKVPGHLVNTVYNGIPEQLAQLRERGYYLAIATCKPEYQAAPICRAFHLDTMVDGLYGASKDGSRINKNQVIEYCFAHIGFDRNAGDRALMIGDRWTDIDGARACGLDTIGCRWGYAEDGEMESHGAYEIIDRVDQLVDAVERYFR